MIYVHSLGRASRYYSDRTALAGDERLSFSELDNRIGGMAAALTAEGFVAGDRLALLLPNSLEYIQLVLACSWLGVIAVPLNTRLSPVEIDRVLADSSPRGLVRHSSLPIPTIPISWQRILDKNPLETRNDPPPEILYAPEAILALIYTSGTTGRPKGVMVTHANILANINHLNYWMPYGEGGVHLHAAPIFHIADFPAMFAAPVFGASQVTMPKFDPQSFCETVERDRVTHTILVPTMINILTQFRDARKYDLNSLATLGYGGSPMAPEIIERTRELLPHVRLIQIYGLSETGFLTGLQDHEHTGDRLLSCGRPCPGIDLRVADQSGNPVGAGKPGELTVRGDNVMPGYWNNPVETVQTFHDGWFHTGDVGYQDHAGYCYILDRLKDMIVTGGENVYSGEVEAVIYAHPAVCEAAVFGIPDPKWGELVTACVVLKPGMAMTVDELVAHCRQSLASYKIPRRVEFLETELPKNGGGKILKKALRDRFWANQDRAVS
ncbi:MAG TPA: long-chain fatty acid--CoA ligase [Terriglobia bacterium]|nr:long-chain fatty acid--CoA ligase [Terriglobia bacterium]